MDFAGINYLSVLLAALAAFVFGGAFYGILGKSWMKAARIDPEHTHMSPALFVTSALCELVIAWVLAGVIGHLGSGQVSIVNGLISAAFLWFGFIATVLTVNHRYQGFGWNLTIIDGLHWLGVLLLMGLIIGAFGV